MGGSGYQLVQLELHGNKLRNVTHLQRSVVMCSSLRHLLETLNGVDRYGRRALPADVMDVPDADWKKPRPASVPCSF
nr:hypothetical protein BaRGS_003783 [Batillaria attramentaria]